MNECVIDEGHYEYFPERKTWFFILVCNTHRKYAAYRILKADKHLYDDPKIFNGMKSILAASLKRGCLVGIKFVYENSLQHLEDEGGKDEDKVN